MNELERFEQVPGQTTFMTTRELADALDVDVRTIQQTVKKLFDPANVLSRVINGGKSMVFTAEQAAQIKQEVQRHHNLKSRQIDAVSSRTEEMGKVLETFEIITRWLQELRDENNELRAKYTRLISFTDKAGDARKAVNFTEAAERLGIRLSDFIEMIVRLRLVARRELPSRGYYYKPARKYSALFVRRLRADSLRSSAQLLVTEAGLEFLARLVAERLNPLKQVN